MKIINPRLPFRMFCFSLFINHKTLIVYSVISDKHQLLLLHCVSHNRGEKVRGPRDQREQLEARLSELTKLTNCGTTDIAIKLATDMIKHY